MKYIAIIFVSFLFFTGCPYRPVYHCDEILEIIEADATDKDKIHVIKDHFKIYHPELLKMYHCKKCKWKLLTGEIRDTIYTFKSGIDDIIVVDTFYYEGIWEVKETKQE